MLPRFKEEYGMNAKLLIVACCLLAVVQARPSGQKAKCYEACTAGDSNGYKDTHSYNYRFQHEVVLRTELSKKQSSSVKLEGTARVESHLGCEMNMWLDVNASASIAADKFTSREETDKTFAALKEPLRFAFQNGQVKQVCPSSSETRASLNLKRAILSQIQFAAKRGEAKQQMETDIHGDCWTEYTPESRDVLLKTTDLSSCSLNYQVYPMTGVRSTPLKNSIKKQTITTGSVQCRIQLNSDRDLVKQVTCIEKQTHSSDGTTTGLKETVEAKTKLSLISEADDVTRALGSYEKRTSLKMKHKSSKECQDRQSDIDEFELGNECVERRLPATGKTSAHFEHQSRQILQELCQTTANETVTRYSAQKYSELVKSVRGISEESDFKKFYTWAKTDFCKDNKVISKIVDASLMNAGTNQSIRYILDQIKSISDSSQQSDLFIKSLANFQHPTADILPVLLEVLKEKLRDSLTSIASENYAVASLTRKICQGMEQCEKEPKVKAVIDFFSEQIGSNCEMLLEENNDNAFVALLSIGNLGRVNGGASRLIKCAKNQDLKMAHRVFAVQSLRGFQHIDSEQKQEMISILLDKEMDSEMRITIYQILAKHDMQPKSQLIRSVHQILSSQQEDLQVQFYIYTHLKNQKQQVKQLFQSVLSQSAVLRRMEKLNRRQYSNNMAASYYSSALVKEAQVDGNLIYSQKSMVPRSVNLNMTVNDASNGLSMNLMEIGVRMEGMETLMEKFYDQMSEKFGTKQKDSSRQKRSAQFQLSDEQKQLKKSVDKPRFDIYTRYYGSVSKHFTSEGATLETIPEIIKSSDPKLAIEMLSDIVKNQAMNQDFGTAAGTLSEQTVAIPTIAGMPVLIKHETHYLTNMRMKKSLKSKSLAKIDFEMEMKPVAAMHTARILSVDAVFERAGIETAVNGYSETGAKVVLKSDFTDNTDRRFTFNVEPLVRNQKLADLKTSVHFFGHDAKKQPVKKAVDVSESAIPKKESKCSDRGMALYFGYKICMHRLTYTTKSGYSSQMRTPGYFQLSLDQWGNQKSAFEVTLNVLNKPNKKQVLILVGNKHSTDRHVKIDLSTEVTEQQTTVRAEVLNALVPVKANMTVKKTAERQYDIEGVFGFAETVYNGGMKLNLNHEKGMKLNGAFTTPKIEKPVIDFDLTHKYKGMTWFLLPESDSKLTMKGFYLKESTFQYKLSNDDSKFHWEMRAEQKDEEAKAANRILYRVIVSDRDQDQKKIQSLTYDLESHSTKGQQIIHSLHAKLRRDRSPASKEMQIDVNHRIQYAQASSAPSPLSFSISAKLQDKSTDDQLFAAQGEGELTHWYYGRQSKVDMKNLKIQYGRTEDKDTQLKQLRIGSVNFSLKNEGYDIDYKTQVRYLPLKQWTKKQQFLDLEVTALAKKGPNQQEQNTVQLMHAANCAAGKLLQVAKLQFSNDILFQLNHEYQKIDKQIQHKLFVQEIFGNSFQTTNQISWPKEQAMNIDSEIQVNKEKFLTVKQQLQYPSSQDQYQLISQIAVEAKEQKYQFSSSSSLSREAFKNFMTLMQYQQRLMSQRYNVQKSMQLFAKFVTSLKYSDEFKLTGPKQTDQLSMQHVADFTQAKSMKYRNEIEKTDNGKQVWKYVLALEKMSNGTDMQVNVPMMHNLLMKVQINDKLVQSKANVKVTKKQSGQWTAEVAVDSSDSQKMHKITLETKSESTQDQVSATMKLNGNVLEQQLDTTANLLVKRENQKVQITGQLECKPTNTKLEITATKEQNKLQSNLKFNCDCWLLKVDNFEHDMQMEKSDQVLKVESSLKLSQQEKASILVNIQKQAMKFDIKIAHEQFREAGVVATWQNENDQKIRPFFFEAKAVAFGRNVLIKQQGELRFVMDATNIVDFFTKVNFELQGLEQVVSGKKYELETLFKILKNMDFEVVGKLTDSEKSKQLLSIETKFQRSSPKFEVVLLTNYQTEQKYIIKAEASKAKVAGEIRFGQREATAELQIDDSSDKVKKFFFKAGSNFFRSDAEVKTISAEGSINMPIDMSNIDASLNIQLPVQQLKQISLKIDTMNTEKELLIEVDSKDTKYQLLYVKCSTENIYHKSNIQITTDLRPLPLNCDGVKIAMDYSWTTKQATMNFSIKTLNADKTYLTVTASTFSKPQKVGAGAVIESGDYKLIYDLDIYSGRRYNLQFSKGQEQLFTTNFLLINGQLTGEVKVLGKEYSITKVNDKEYELSVKDQSDASSAFKLKVQNKSNDEEIIAALQVDAAGEQNILQVGGSSKKIEILYGDLNKPNRLTVKTDEYPKITISHVTEPENSEIAIHSQKTIQNELNQYPLEIEFNLESISQFKVKGEFADLFTFEHEHDFSKVPRSLELTSSLKQKNPVSQLWMMNVNFDVNQLSQSEVSSQIGDAFKVTLDQDSFELKVKEILEVKAELKIESQKKELEATLQIPSLLKDKKTMKISHERLGNQQIVDVHYQSESEVNARATVKVAVSPKFVLDVAITADSKKPMGYLKMSSLQSGLQLEVSNETGKLMTQGTADVEFNGQKISAWTFKIDNERSYLPLKVDITSTGVIEGVIALDLSQEDGSHLVKLALKKVGNFEIEQQFELKTAEVTEEQVIRDFTIKLETAKRQQVLSKETKQSGEVVVEAFLDKKSQVGFSISYKADLTYPKPEMTIDLQLPTRNLQFISKAELEDKKYKLQTAFAYDAKRDQSKSIDFTIDADYTYPILVSVSLKAPFLKQQAKLEAKHESHDEGFTSSLAYYNGEAKQFALKTDCRTQADKTIMQLETSGQSQTAQSTLTLTVQSKNIDGQLVHVGDVKLTVPSKSFDRTAYFKYEPRREITVACDRGTGLKVKYTVNERLNDLRVLLISSEEKAAKLTISADKRNTLLTIRLKTGSGKTVGRSEQLNTEFIAEHSLLTVSTGFQQRGRQVHVAAFAGKVPVGQKMRTFTSKDAPAHVPAGVVFFTAGLELAEKSQVKFFGNWRFAQSEQVKSAIEYIQESMQIPTNTFRLQTVGEVLLEAASSAGQTVSDNIDVSQLISEIMTISSEDLDQLKRFIEQAIANNDFFLGSIVEVSQAVMDRANQLVEPVVQAVTDIVQQISKFWNDLKVADLMQSVVDSVYEYARTIPFAQIWEDFIQQLEMLTRTFQFIIDETIKYINEGLDWLSRIFTDSASADSLLTLGSEMINKVAPFDAAVRTVVSSAKRVQKVVKSAYDSIKSEYIDYIMQLILQNHAIEAVDIQRFISYMRAEVQNLYEKTATPYEKDAMIQMINMAEYFSSSEKAAQFNWENLRMSYAQLQDGRPLQALVSLMRPVENVITEWRPECDQACLDGQTFATIQGKFFSPIYMNNLKPSTWKAKFTYLQAPLTVMNKMWRMLSSVSNDGYIIVSAYNDWRDSGASLMQPIVNLLRIKHRTAIVSGDNHVITFDGLSLKHSKPCSYVLAHDFQNNEFTVLQTYDKDTASIKRKDLQVKIGNAIVTISRNGALKVNNQKQNLPTKRAIGDKTLEATKEFGVIDARFHSSNLKDILRIRCSDASDSCVIQVHPLLHGRVAGLAGSNNDRNFDDIRGSSQEHMQFWTADECVETGEATTEIQQTEDAQCQRWFQNGADSFDKCFSTINPQPFLAMCTQKQAANQDICNVATLYVERCRAEKVNVNTPRRCAECKLSSGKKIDAYTMISDQQQLKKRLQVVFLLENSRCAKEAGAAARVTNFEAMMRTIDNLPNKLDGQLAEFGVATYGSQSGLRVQRIGDSNDDFSSDIIDVKGALQRARSQQEEQIGEADVLKAIARINEKFSWDPLAQKHLIILSCQSCSANPTDNVEDFSAAFKAVQDLIHVHVITSGTVPQVQQSSDWRYNMIGFSKRKAYFSDRSAQPIASFTGLNPSADCAAEIALSSQTGASGSTWSIDEFKLARDSDKRPSQSTTPAMQLVRQLVNNEIKERFNRPDCMTCSCSLSQQMTAEPKCRIGCDPLMEL